MRKRCVLHTSGYEFVFYLQSLDSSTDSTGIIAELALHPSYGGYVFKSTAHLIAIKDLQRLISYFENHISELQKSSEYESPTFMSYDCTFTLAALQGEVCANQEGRFSVRCMVNLGRTERGYPNTYLGGEAVVSITEVKAFTTCLKTAINECKSS